MRTFHGCFALVLFTCPCLSFFRNRLDCCICQITGSNAGMARNPAKLNCKCNATITESPYIADNVFDEVCMVTWIVANSSYGRLAVRVNKSSWASGQSGMGRVLQCKIDCGYFSMKTGACRATGRLMVMASCAKPFVNIIALQSHGPGFPSTEPSVNMASVVLWISFLDGISYE